MVEAIRSEFIKVRTVRSSVVLAVLAVVAPVGLTALLAAVVPVDEVEGAADAFNLATASLGVMQLLVAVIGALTIAAEYRFGTIRVTFTATPQRARVLAAKVVVVVGLAVVVAVVTIVLNVAVGRVILAARDLDFSLTGAGVPRALVGNVIVAVLYGLVGFGLGALFRTPVAAIVVVVAQPVIVEPILVAVRTQVFKWLPFAAGSALTTVDPDDNFVQSPVAGGLVLGAYAALLVVAGWVMVVRRDA